MQINQLNVPRIVVAATFIERYEPALWVHGHMHDSFDYRLGRTRVVCNPRGYFPHQLNPDFRPLLVVQTQQP